MGLLEYQRKRNFNRTREPRGGHVAAHKRLAFVVQKHAASHLHYDFRLELDGVLKSWAVPKGPDLDPAQKRLAIQVEDHPVQYGDFEGIIPEGEYGGGTVMVWDRGTWETEPDSDPLESYRAGRLKFELHGQKLRGKWMLVRRGGASTLAERHWFLIKERDRFASATKSITDSKPLSAITHCDMDEIAADADRVWGRNGAVKKPRRRSHSLNGAATSAKQRAIGSRSPSSRTEQNSPTSPNVVGGVALTHPDKVLYPDEGFTKLDVARYYEQVADWMLPHVVGRPLALVRCPNGRGKPCFFQKHPDSSKSRHLVALNVSETAAAEYHLAIKDRAGLIELVQLGVLEIHVWGSRARLLEKPDRLVFDLDPDPSLGWPTVVAAAREVRLLLEQFGLQTFVKTTGGKGLHLVAPIRPRVEWPEAKAFCKAVADLIVQAAPDRYIATMSKAARAGKIFIDYLRNSRGATAVAAYSTRARPGATVSAPLTWDELSGRIKPDRFNIRTMPARLVAMKMDPWAELPKVKQTITAAMIRQIADLRGTRR